MKDKIIEYKDIALTLTKIQTGEARINKALSGVTAITGELSKGIASIETEQASLKKRIAALQTKQRSLTKIKSRAKKSLANLQESIGS